jgi:prepilin signal peptidase PulO-like enzyme (type II secretory pathway)
MFFFEFVLIFFFAFFLSTLASFFNVVIFRTAREESFVKGRSKCESCHKQIAWYDNIPLFSFLFLKGKCRYCHKKIAKIYFLSELLAFILGLAFVPAYLQLPFLQFLPVQQLMLYFLFVFVLLFTLLADLRYLIVPDFFVAILIILAVLIQLFSGENWLLPITAVLFSSVFFYALYFLASKILHKPALGFGDIKLMMPLAFLLSWPKVILSIFLAFIIGGIFAMLLLLTGKKKIGQALPFAPFLIVAFLITFVFGEAIWQWYFGFLF